MRTDPEVMRLFDDAAAHLADAGYEVAEVELPQLDATFQLWANLISTEITLLQAPQMRELGSAPFVGALEGILHMATILDHAGYMQAMAYRSRLLREWLTFLETWPVILAPVSVRRTPALDADLKGDAAVRDIFWNDLRFNAAISVLGLPVAVAPVGLAGGAPVGVQLISSRYREDLCLAAAEAIEARVGVLAHRLWDR